MPRGYRRYGRACRRRKGGGGMARPACGGAGLGDVGQHAGLSRAALAAPVEVPPERIRLWELGLEQPQPRLVPRLARALGLSPWELLNADEKAPSLADLRVAAGLTLQQ